MCVYRWDKKTYDAVKKAQEEHRESMGPEGAQLPDPQRESIADQARRLLRGEERWKPVWEDVGRPVEVEKDVRVR